MTETVLTPLGYLAAALIGVLGKVWWDKIKRMEDRVERAEQDAKEIKENYLSRFETVNSTISATKSELTQSISKTKEEIVKSITDLRVELARNQSERRKRP